MREEYLWVEKYRPRTVDDCILPSDLKQTFQTFDVQLLRLAYPDGTNIETGTHSVWPATGPAPESG